jgi:PAS domain S-box-containing protein
VEKIINILQLERKHLKYFFILAILLLVSVNVVSYMNIQDLKEIESYASQTNHNIVLMENLRDKLSEAQTGRHFYFITGEKNYLVPYNNVSSSIDTIYTKLKALTTDNNTIQLYLDTLSGLVKNRFEVMAKSIEMQDRKRSSVKSVTALLDEGKEINAMIMNMITKMQTEEYNSLRDKIEMTNSKSKFTKLITAGGTTLSILMLVFIFGVFDYMGGKGFTGKKEHKLSQDELETIVRERTAEISKINSRMYKEIEMHKQAEDALKSAEREYKNLFEQAHDAIMIFEPDTEKVLDINKRGCEVYGIPHEQFVGLSLKTISKNIPDGERHIRMILEKGFFYNFQTVHYRKDGTEMLMEINAAAINYKGKTAILAINRDITDRILSYIPLPGS